jgi:hypothetical protein
MYGLRSTRLMGLLIGAAALTAVAACGPSTGSATGAAAGSNPSSPAGEIGPAPTTPPAAQPAPANPPANPPQQNNPQGGPTSAPAWPTPADCIVYNPRNVTVSFQDGLYTVADGNTIVTRVNGQPGDDTGTKALALAQRYSRHCFIGRGNLRPDHFVYVFDYWRNSSGLTPSIPDQDNDCSQYNQHNLTVDDMGNGDGWRVRDHDNVLHVFDNEADARNGKLVLSKYSMICTFGNSNDDNPQTVTYEM